MVSKKVFDVIGKQPIRHDGYDKVTGKALYGADIHPTGMLHGKMLRSPHAHAKITSIDISKAASHPGVRAVVTAHDLPHPTSGDPNENNNILTGNKVLYKGHAIAAIAATNPHIAEEALSLIDIKYEILPAVVDVEQAMESGASQLHQEHTNNVANHTKLTLGDIEKGFQEADVIIEREYHTKTVHQGYIEPHSATAIWDANDKVTIWCSSQGHFEIGQSTAKTLGLASSKVKVIPMEIGGGFGGKTTIYLEPVTALLAQQSGHPVKMSMTRAEVLEATGPTSGTFMKVKIGATSDGKITAAQADLRFEAGAFPGSPVGAAAQCIFTPYDVKNIMIDAYDVVNNKPPTCAYRAPGAPQGAFAAESVVDELCREIGIDAMDFRIKNGAREGTRRANGTINPLIGCIETAEATKSTEHYMTPLNGENQGRGVAMGFWINGGGPACATANVNFDGTVNLIIGSMDIGGSRTGAAQQFAETLGMLVEDVYPQVGDTESIGFTSMTGGSSVAFKTGWACYEAAKDVKKQMLERAATLLETSADQLELELGTFVHKHNPELTTTFKNVAESMNSTGGPVVGKANINPSGAGSAFAACIVDVDVDVETGKVTILRCTMVQDVGKAIHPGYVEGQLQGGAAQGIGWALNEEYFMSQNGQMLNSTFLDYRMPISLDLPMIDTVIVEVANPSHPYGVRGVAEVPIVPPLAAVANAVYDAIGVRMTKLPINPSAITSALGKTQ